MATRIKGTQLNLTTVPTDGSGLTSVNAASLNGLNASQFIRSDINDTINGVLTIERSSAGIFFIETAASVDQRRWLIVADNEEFKIQERTDADVLVATPLKVDRNGNVYENNTALSSKYEAKDSAIIKTNASQTLSVGYPSNVETLTSNTITPDMTQPPLKIRAVDGAVTLNFPINGNGACEILLQVDGTGYAAPTLGANMNAVGTLPALSASTNYIVRIVAWSGTYATVEMVEI